MSAESDQWRCVLEYQRGKRVIPIVESDGVAWIAETDARYLCLPLKPSCVFHATDTTRLHAGITTPHWGRARGGRGLIAIPLDRAIEITASEDRGAALIGPDTRARLRGELLKIRERLAASPPASAPEPRDQGADLVIGEVDALVAGAEVIEIDGECHVRLSAMRAPIETREMIAAELRRQGIAPTTLYKPSGASYEWWPLVAVDDAESAPGWMQAQIDGALNTLADPAPPGVWHVERPAVVIEDPPRPRPSSDRDRVARAYLATRGALSLDDEEAEDPLDHTGVTTYHADGTRTHGQHADPEPAPASPIDVIRARLDALEQQQAGADVTGLRDQVEAIASQQARLVDVVQSQHLALTLLERHVSRLTMLLRGQAAVTMEQLTDHPAALEEAH